MVSVYGNMIFMYWYANILSLGYELYIFRLYGEIEISHVVHHYLAIYEFSLVPYDNVLSGVWSGSSALYWKSRQSTSLIFGLCLVIILMRFLSSFSYLICQKVPVTNKWL